jgi:hypothetical protein
LNGTTAWTERSEGYRFAADICANNFQFATTQPDCCLLASLRFLKEVEGAE